MPIEALLKWTSLLLALNVAALAVIAARGTRGRFLLWGVQSALMWLWLVIGALLLLGLRRYGTLMVLVLIAPLIYLCRALWTQSGGPRAPTSVPPPK